MPVFAALRGRFRSAGLRSHEPGGRNVGAIVAGMRKQIIAVGDSAGVELSATELRDLGLTLGDPVEVTVRFGVMEIKPINKYADLPLEELLALVDARAAE